MTHRPHDVRRAGSFQSDSVNKSDTAESRSFLVGTTESGLEFQPPRTRLELTLEWDWERNSKRDQLS
ncbi:hypothetical protein EVAR_94730_1 [Eumeta japonica]|uniref:Uncharacterized protein n=1 Tax=Eumeta variegata TaxID=151549 RepID=A0A4C1UWE1_EUMVA|nr:hypothetical protein EVAR_94730_1 [Eumeta japonica]